MTLFDLHRMTRRAKGLALPPEATAVEFTSLAFSGDGKLLLTQAAGPEWLLTLWQWDKAKPVVSTKSSPDPNRPVYKVSFHPTDPSIICATGDGICKVRGTGMRGAGSAPTTPATPGRARP